MSSMETLDALERARRRASAHEMQATNRGRESDRRARRTRERPPLEGVPASAPRAERPCSQPLPESSPLDNVECACRTILRLRLGRPELRAHSTVGIETLEC